MGYVPPPRPLSREEFQKRWDEGARTMRDLDPAFFKWQQNSKRRFLYLLGGMVLAVSVMVIILVVL